MTNELRSACCGEEVKYHEWSETQPNGDEWEYEAWECLGCHKPCEVRKTHVVEKGGEKDETDKEGTDD